MRLAIALGLLAASASAAPRRTTATRLAELATALRCTDTSAPDDPARRLGCLVATRWNDALADALPPGDTPLVGATMEVPDARPTDWRWTVVPAVGGLRVDAQRGRFCAMDMYTDTPAQRAAVDAVKAPLVAAMSTLDAPLVVPAAVAAEARERVAHAPSVLARRGGSWATRFQGAVELRHLGRRWFLVETRRGDSGLWVSTFTADFTVAP